MKTSRSDRLVRVTDLLDRPGASRRVDLALPVPGGLVLDLAEVTGPLRLTGVIESVVEGLLVRGTLTAPLRLSCARCLRDVEQTVAADVVEMFSDPDEVDADADVDPGYEIVDGALDLDTLLRDALVPAVPYRPLCREDCKGLCATCGANHNVEQCDCTDTITDSRWLALEGLRLPDAD